MDCIVHRAAKSWTRLSDFHFQEDKWATLSTQMHVKPLIVRKAAQGCCSEGCFSSNISGFSGSLRDRWFLTQVRDKPCISCFSGCLWVFLFSHISNIFSLSPSTLKTLCFFQENICLVPLCLNPGKVRMFWYFPCLWLCLLKGFDPKLSFYSTTWEVTTGRKSKEQGGCQRWKQFSVPVRDILMIVKLVMKNHFYSKPPIFRCL